MRVNKFIAQNSQYSRRKADELIEQGRVRINGKIINAPGVVVDPLKDQITIDKNLLKEGEFKKLYYKMYKPKGYITTLNDELGRKSIAEIIPSNQNLKPVGRLDKDSEGLLLLSNDGEFIYSHTHPKHNLEKEYIVELDGLPSKEDLKKLEDGITIDGYKLQKCQIKKTKTNYHITLKEGRNRQIRKMFEFTRTPVKYLQRIRIGNILLEDMKPGEIRLLTTKELNVY